VNLTASISAERIMSSGGTESICWSTSKGRDCRQESAKREFRESRMQTERAMVSRGMQARARMAWICGIEGAVRDAEEGMRLERWRAGPSRVGSRISLCAENKEDGEMGS